ncbi:MAG: PAS domain S-box protein [Flavobacteriales bacterium]|nr:PAS domain S-box protein [Flavobacteriales bacterium]
MTDITKDTLALRPEDRLKLLSRENELLNSIVQGASDSVYAKDLEGRYITINQTGADYFGCSIDEVIGRTDFELMGEEVAQDFAKYDQRIFETGTSVSYESRGLFGKGHTYFSTSKSALRDAEGNVIGLIGISRDVTNARLSEEKYRFIFDNAPISFWEEDFSQVKLFLDELREVGITDLRRYFRQNPSELDRCIDLIQVQNVNRTTLQMYGVVDKEGFISKIHRNFTPESESIFAEEFIALYEGKTFFQAEGSFVNLNGDTIEVQFILNVLPGHEDDLSLVLISIVDVTDTNQLASELNTIKHRYQSIVEAQTEMICRINPKGKILFRNLAFAKFFKFKEGSESTRFPTLFPPEELDKCEKYLEALSARNDQVTFELRNYDKEGDMVWQEWSVTAFFGSTGTLLGYQAVGTDVTSRKMAQEALAASEARWRSVFEHADDLIMTVNSEGYILSVNDYPELSSEPKWAGRTIDDVMLPENAQAAMELIGEVFASGKPKKTDFRLANRDGQGYSTYGVALSPIFHGSRVLTVVCIARNISDTKEIEKQTREALIEGQENERMRVSQELHDGLGQLFTAIKLNVQQLRSSMESRSENATAEALNALEDNIGFAITEVKNISRNLMPDVLWQFGLRPAMEDLVEKIRTTTDMQISLELVDVDVRFTPELEKALFRMSQELINNSIRHGVADHIYVQLINHGDSIVLMVEDDGNGFDPQEPSKGFGLRNIRSRAEVWEGVVEIDSAVGLGTVTTIEIPLKKRTE